MKIIQVNKWDKYWLLKVLEDLWWRKIKTKWWNIVSKRYIKCLCECWKVWEYRLSDLRIWNTKWCWCLRWKKNKTHWLTNSKIYHIWFLMKQRCNNPNKQHYHRYWWRWITYDKKWETFEWFYEDMKEWYKEHLTIDRIDNNWNYCKTNCRWTTQKEQCRNKKNNVNYKY